MTEQMRKLLPACAAALLLATASPADAGDWLQWRGPHLNGASDETKLPVSFTRTENLAWVVPMPGLSGATPIVIGERIFLPSSSDRSEDLVALCLSTKDGQTIWSKTLGRCDTPPRGEIAACSPVSDGKLVFFLFGSGDLAALDLDGNVKWSRELVKDYGSLAIKFGYSATPLLHKGRLYLPVLRCDKPYSYSPGAAQPRTGPLESFVLCIDAATGKTIWKQRRDTDATEESRETYITPMAVEAAGRTEIIIPGGEFVTAHDSESGKELWRWEYTKKREIWQRIVPSPVIAEGLIIVCQSQMQGVYALRPGASGTVPHDKYVWKFDGASPDVCTPLLYQGRLYLVAEDDQILTCLDSKTGKILWQQKVPAAGPYRGSPTGADGKIYLMSEGGDYIVLSVADKPQELHRFSTKARPCRGTIVPANGSLYLRLSKHLLCIRATP